jgi:hypothetical protein
MCTRDGPILAGIINVVSTAVNRPNMSSSSSPPPASNQPHTHFPSRKVVGRVFDLLDNLRQQVALLLLDQRGDGPRSQRPARPHLRGVCLQRTEPDEAKFTVVLEDVLGYSYCNTSLQCWSHTTRVTHVRFWFVADSYAYTCSNQRQTGNSQPCTIRPPPSTALPDCRNTRPKR